MHLIDAARAAKVGRYVFVSVSGNLLKHGDNPLLAAKQAVENHLKQAGLTYTILRPTCFMEIWLSPPLGFDCANGKATIYGSGQNKTSYISLHTVADFAFEEIAGRTLEKQFVPEEALQARKSAANNSVEQTFADLTLAAARGDKSDMSETFKAFQVRPKSVREYAETVTSKGIGL
jgi:nucleoside-diphosphate-sugar epimerase